MPLSILKTHLQVWRDEFDCSHSAKCLAAQLTMGNAVIELHGDLGAGKTTFARHLLHAMGVQGTIKSPTYSLMELYNCGNNIDIAHFDFYRFHIAQEWEDAGFRDIFAAPGIKLIEWAELARPFLPQPDLQLQLAMESETSRLVHWNACTPWGLTLLEFSHPGATSA